MMSFREGGGWWRMVEEGGGGRNSVNAVWMPTAGMRVIKLNACVIIAQGDG